MSNFVLTKQHLREVLIFCFNWKKSAAEAYRMLVIIVTLLQLINHVGNGFDVSRWKFQRWKQASLWTTKKIRRQRIRGIIRRRSELNARGACRIIGGNSISCFWLRVVSEREIGNDSKTRKLGALWTETENVERRFFTCEQLIQRQQRKGFLHRIVTGDEKWIF